MKTPVKAIIVGCQGPELTPQEYALFQKYNPLGLILFRRNIQNPEQLKKLIVDFRKCVGRTNAPVLIDQEGGTVQRLKPPYWTKLPHAEEFGKLYLDDKKKAIRAVKKHAKTLAKELLELGINCDCWPCLDVQHRDHNVMAHRCYSDSPEIVAELAQISIDTALSAGLMPIVKHFPGYGRVIVDPHQKLPTVRASLKTLEKTDFYPFRQVDTPVWGMTAHVIYTALDREKPATLSKTAIDYIRNKIGFNGFLICDDMTMGALSSFGTPAEIANKILMAGCDSVLHCNGIFADMEALFPSITKLSPLSQKRLKAAESLI
ncbi:MAG: beta-N-acetylhexosaminidase [Alphaproteobacteria bacterium]|nr:beta-N-acetylhexosaminidase [Alphaproteobacteria bacterium]